MRISFTASGNHVGGATMAMFNLMIGLLRLGHEPVLIATTPSKKYEDHFERLRKIGVEMHFTGTAHSGLTHWLRLASHALTNLNRYNIDLVHLHLPKEAAFLFYTLKSLHIPVVSTFEGDPFLEARFDVTFDKGIIIKVGSNLMAMADAVTACSSWLAGRLGRVWNINVYAVPNPIDVERFLGIKEWCGSEKIVVALARLVPIKGIDVLVKAARRVSSECRDVRFIVAGEGPSKQELMGLINKYGLREVFSLVGFTSSPENLLSKSYMVVMPSLYEPFGMPAAEAGAALRPVVASNTGGLAEIVIDGYNGFLARPGDPVDLAEKIIWLLENEDVSKEMGRRGRVRVLENYTPVLVAKKYLEIYQRALNNSR